MSAATSLVGDVINFRGLVYAPVNEYGVILLFGKILDDLNMYVEEIKPGFPDCIARRFVGKGWERIAIEFEYCSKNFVTHGHDIQNCDMIVCWHHDWQNCPVEVIELKSEILNLDNDIVKRNVRMNDEDDGISEYCAKNSTTYFKNIIHNIVHRLKIIDEKIWIKVSGKSVGIYSPSRSFASIRANKSVIKLDCFCGSNLINKTRVANKRFSPRWCSTTVYNSSDIDFAVSVLGQSYQRLLRALSLGEATGYFSGGEPIGSPREMFQN